MKKYLKLLILGLSVLTTVSCDKQLSLFPYNALDNSQAFQTPTDFDNAGKGAYQAMVQSTSYFGGDWILVPDILSDNLLTCSAGRGTGLTFHNWIYNANATTNIYADGYAAIRRANAIIENIKNLSSGAVADNARAEALAIRAMVHLDMVKYFGKAYTQAADADLGVPYVIQTADASPSRESVKSNYDKIVADLIDAEKTINASNGIGRLNKAAVQGLLARVYLFRGEWQNCVDAATRCLTSSPSVGSIANFPAIWKDVSNDGVLFKVNIIDKDGVQVGVNYSQTSGAGTRPEFVVDFDFYGKYQATDIRKTAYFITNSFSAVKYNNIFKHFGRASGNANVVDVKALRTSEILISRAEAYARLNKNTEALVDLNTLRQSRYSNFVVGIETGADLLTAILFERRLELAFEGHRFFDLKRLGLGVTRSSFGDKSDGTGINNVTKTLPAGDIHFQLPLPQSEINANPNIVQNPGY